MKIPQRRILTALPLLLLGGLLTAGSTDPYFPDSTDTITAGELRSFVYFLASDEMRGRDTGTPENEIAVQYFAHQFEMLGLEPGAPGGYEQSFTLVQSRLGDKSANQLRVDGPDLQRELRLMEDFFPLSESASVEARGDLLFAGYGISAPEYDYDDYGASSAEGKLVLIMTGEPGVDDPARFEGIVDSEHSRTLSKLQTAQQNGAAGVLIFSPSRSGKLLRLARREWPSERERATYHLKLETDEIRIPAAMISTEIAEELLGREPRQIRQEIDRSLQPRTRLLAGMSAALKAELSRHETQSANVLARLPGSDSELAHEEVLISAHLDHVGERNDRIFNGADDDASGSAGVLEIAEAFIQSPLKPRRSIVFALWNAEEQGLLGSRYYALRPPVQLENVRALFQMDMIGRSQEVTDSGDPRFGGLSEQTAEANRDSVHLVGYSRSRSLTELVETANSSVSLRLLKQFDHHELNIIRRSDSWPFLSRGVPSMFFTTGLHPDYHTPEDLPEKIEYDKLERVVRLVFLSAWNAANGFTPIQLDPLGGGSK